MSQKTALDFFDIPSRVVRNTSSSSSAPKKNVDGSEKNYNQSSFKSTLKGLLDNVGIEDEDVACELLDSFLCHFCSPDHEDKNKDTNLDVTSPKSSNHEAFLTYQSDSSVVHSLKIQCYDLVNDQASQSLSIEEVENFKTGMHTLSHHHKTIPELIDFVSLQDLKVNIEYALIASLHQGCQRIHTSVTACFLESFAFSLHHIAAENEVTAPVLQSMARSHKGSETVQVKLDILSETVLDFLASPNRPGSENRLSIAHNNSIVLQFLLLVIQNRLSEAYALVCRLVVAVQELLPSDLDNWCSDTNTSSLSTNKSNERGVDTAGRDAGSIYARKLYVLFVATQLQLVLNILDLSFHNAVLNAAGDSHVDKSSTEKDSIVVKPNDSGVVVADSGTDQCSEKCVLHEQLLSNLTHFATTYRSLLPVLSVTIRTGLVYVSLFERPDVLRLLLDPSGQFSSQQQDKYLTSISQKIAKRQHSAAATETGTETGIKHTPGAGSASMDAQQKELRGWADRDEGYKHLQKLTREQCNKLLMPQLPGAFIIRPHETNRDQFFLSFRGATEEEGVKHAIIRREIATDVTRGSSGSGGDKVAQYICGKVGPCGSLKQLLSEISLILSTPLLFDHVVKFDRNVLHPHHSLDINYPLLVHTLPKHLSSLLSTVSVDQYNRYKTNSTNINNNNEETALNTAMNRNSSSGLFNNLFEEEDSSSGDDDEDISEGGDTAFSDSESDGINIDDDNDGIAAANKDGSDSPFSPAAASDQQEGDEFYLSENSSVGNNSPYTLYSPKEQQQSEKRSEKDKNVWKDVSSKKISHRVRKFTSRTARANKLLSEDANKWNMKKQSNSMNNLVERLVALLALREFLQQLGAAASRVVDSVYTTEIVKQHTKREVAQDSDTRHSSFLLEHITHTLLSDSALPATVLDSLVAEPADAGPDKSTTASSALNRQVSLFAALTRRVTLCVVSAERALQGLIVPPLPRFLHYIPVPYSYPDPDRIAEHLNNRYPDAPSSAGLLMAESLMKLIIRSMNSSQSVVARYIKFPGHGLGYGGTEYVADNCLEITELTQLLVKWRTVSLKYSSSTGLAGATVADIPIGGGMDGGSSGSRSATPVNAKSPGGKFDFHNDSSQAAAGGNTSSGSVHSGSSGNSAGSSSLNSNVKKGLNDLKSNLKKMGSHLHIPHVHHSGSKDNLLALSNNKASSHLGSSTGRSVDASYLERTIHICELLTKINAHLNVPITSTNAEYTQFIFSWLFSLGIIQQVTRLAEHAFALPTTYYKYVDLWEVRVLHDYSLASEKVKLGRHVYGACATLAKGSATSNDNSNNNSSTTVKSKTTTITTNVNSGGQSPINVTKNIVLSSDTLASAGSAGTAYKNTASPIVHNMLEFVSQLRRRYRSSDSGNLDGNMSVTSASPYSYLKRDVSYLSAGTVEGGGCEVYRQSADYRASLMQLWESLGAEMYIISSIAGTANAFERENIPILSDNSSGNSSSGVAASQVLLDSGDGGNVTMGDPYLNTLQRYMYRNALYSRLCFPHRYVPNIQVDIYNVKEILSVSSKTISSSGGATSPPMRGIPIGGGNAPLPSNHNYNANYNTLTPSVSAHGGSIEIFATIRLVKDNVKRVDIALLSSNKTVNFDGTVVTGSHKAETNRSTGTNSISSNASTIYRSSAAHSTKTQNTITSISNSVDYVWREQAIFRHALPEGLLYPHLPRQHLLTDGDIHNSVPHSHSSTCVNTATTQSSMAKPPLVKHSSSTGNLSLAHPASTATTTNTSSTTAAAAGGGTVFNATNLHLYHPHDKVVISVFERNFFSDHKLGEVEILLSELTDKKVIRDWYPLVTADKCVSWLIYLQIKLRFQLMTVDISPAPASSKSKQGAAFYTPVGVERSSSGEKNKASKLKSKKSFLGQMDDFF